MAQAVKQNNIQVSEGVKFLKYTYVASVVTLFVIQIYSMLTGSSIVGTLQVNGENVLYKSFTIISLICAVYCLVFKSVCYAKSGCPCCLFKTLSFSFMSICYSLYVVYFFDTVINANAADLLYQVL
jgi:magnesium-transporting ATPase (P-type)